jgi:hypothetical protein
MPQLSQAARRRILRRLLGLAASFAVLAWAWSSGGWEAALGVLVIVLMFWALMLF